MASAPVTTLGGFTRRDVLVLSLALAATIITAALVYLSSLAMLAFVVSTVALALLAALVSRATEQVGTRLSSGATGVLQATLSNVPEFFVSIFALRAGLVRVVQAALIGSVLANLLLVLGLAILLGGLKNGPQRFSPRAPRMIATLLLLAVAALAVPTLVQHTHAPAAGHTDALDIASAVILLVLFLASIPFFVKSGETPERAIPVAERSIVDDCREATHDPEAQAEWSLTLALGMLVLAGIAAAFVSDWFVETLRPTVNALGISETFTGLVIVAIAGNAVENTVGIKLAMHDRAEYAMSIILTSALQVALGLVPVLLLLSYVLGGAVLTLVLPPLLIVALALAALLVMFVISDGETLWLEGAALIGLYGIIAAAFWWG